MIIEVPLARLEDNPYQARQEYGDIAELAGRIRAQLDAHPETMGLLQVPTGRLVNENNLPVEAAQADSLDAMAELLFTGHRVQLAFGHRRKRAFELLARSAPEYAAGVMPVRLVDLDDEQMLDAVWQENHGRRDISAVEEAALLATKLQRPAAGGGSRSQRDVAEEWGLARSTVANRLRLLEAPEVVQEANRAGRLSERQALALLTVQQLAEQANGDVQWGRDPDFRKDSWGQAPPAPADVVEWVATTEAGAQATSEQIRDYIGKALKRAGQALPPAIARFEGDAGRPFVRQASCRGCPKRMAETCLDKLCLGAKKRHYGQTLARAAAEELGLPYGEASGAFRPWQTYQGSKELARLWVAGGRCEHLVVGWCDDGHAAQPLGESWAYGHISEYEAYKGGREGVILGHVGKIEPGCWPEKAAAELEEKRVHPLEAGKKAWVVAAEAQRETIGEKSRRALAAALLGTYEELSPLAATLHLLQAREYKAKLSNEQLVEALVQYAWEKGYYISYSNEKPRERLAVCQKLLDEAGLNGYEVLAEEFAAEPEAVRLLAEWAVSREQSWVKERSARELQPLVAKTLHRLGTLIHTGPEAGGAPAAELDRLVELRTNLELVQTEVESYLGDKEKSEE